MLPSMSNWILCVKIVLISSGVVSLATAIEFAVPLVIKFTVYELPTLWSTLLSLFKPPYLYVIVNGIIIIIVASSRFTQSEPSASSDQSRPLISAKTPPPIEISAAVAVIEASPAAEAEMAVVVYEEEKAVDVKKPVLVNGLEEVENDEEVKNEDVVASWSRYTPPQRISSQETVTETETETETEMEIPLPVTGKRPVLSRFGHRKPLKASPEGGKVSLRVARPKREETLDSVWKMITEECHVPLTRHMKKSDTFANHGLDQLDVVVPDENCSPQNLHVRKLETFKDRTNYHDMPMKFETIRKEPSLSKDELNRRVEAFIQKFNEDMRMQRQESLKQYMEMINRGANYS